MNKIIFARGCQKSQLQKLIEKATPKKVIRSVFYSAICPNCNTRIDEDVEFEAMQRFVEGEDNYCPYCGQKLIYLGEEDGQKKNGKSGY